MPGKRLGGFGSATHLVARFFGSVAPVGPRKGSQQWALGHLNSAERALFLSMSAADRRHAIGVARRALRLEGEERVGETSAPAGFVAAALMHDVGKVESGLGTFSRVFATLAAVAVGRERLVARAAARPGNGKRRPAARLAAYLEHDRLGAELLDRAGSHPLTSTWARDHHLPEERWRVEKDVGRYLKEADGD
ncbi:MAG TPA: hypothetical protein VGP46_08725 [Acidimicrobiales bacterium]|nr:hypothetical protein [Acidimicrobiales bacterium]